MKNNEYKQKENPIKKMIQKIEKGWL